MEMEGGNMEVSGGNMRTFFNFLHRILGGIRSKDPGGDDIKHALWLSMNLPSP